MTFRILKSQIDALGYDFQAAVEEHIKALEAHRFEGNAAPHSYPEVELAIRRVQYPIADQKPDDFVADYEIVDDSPPPPTLAECKQAKIAELRRQEQAAIAALIAPEKRRLTDMMYARACRADPKTAEDLKIIADRQELERQIEEIAFRAAQREAAIADMT